MLRLAIAFTNFGPYHLGRLRALGTHLERVGGELIAYEIAGSQALYPWKTNSSAEPFRWVTLFPDSVLEALPSAACHDAMTAALDRDQPTGLGVVGYARPESLAMIRWGRANRRPTVMMSESQEIDHPRVWWKEAIKRRRVKGCSAGFVGGPRHLDYLAKLGIPRERIAMGYNAVDNAEFKTKTDAARRSDSARKGLPIAPYFLAVSRFAPEKNLPRLVQAYQRYRTETRNETPWELVLCGDGPQRTAIDLAIESNPFRSSIHTPGFLQTDELSRWLAFASAFVHPATSEPWGLAVNEAAACGLPLLVSERAGCVDTFVPDRDETTGTRLDPFDVEMMATALSFMADMPSGERRKLGKNAAAIADEWGPKRFAVGAIEAFQMAFAHQFFAKEPALSVSLSKAG